MKKFKEILESLAEMLPGVHYDTGAFKSSNSSKQDFSEKEAQEFYRKNGKCPQGWKYDPDNKACVKIKSTSSYSF